MSTIGMRSPTFQRNFRLAGSAIFCSTRKLLPSYERDFRVWLQPSIAFGDAGSFGHPSQWRQLYASMFVGLFTQWSIVFLLARSGQR